MAALINRFKRKILVKRIPLSKESGFTLIEVLIAIVLLGFVAGGVFVGLSTAFKVTFVVDKQAIAMSLAQSQLEDLERQAYQTAPTNGEATYTTISIPANIPSSYTIHSYNRAGTPVASIKGVPWDSSTGASVATDGGLQKIMLVIYQGNNPVFTLETYKKK